MAFEDCDWNASQHLEYPSAANPCFNFSPPSPTRDPYILPNPPISSCASFSSSSANHNSYNSFASVQHSYRQPQYQDNNILTTKATLPLPSYDVLTTLRTPQKRKKPISRMTTDSQETKQETVQCGTNKNQSCRSLQHRTNDCKSEDGLLLQYKALASTINDLKLSIQKMTTQDHSISAEEHNNRMVQNENREMLLLKDQLVMEIQKNKKLTQFQNELLTVLLKHSSQPLNLLPNVPNVSCSLGMDCDHNEATMAPQAPPSLPRFFFFAFYFCFVF